MRMSWSASAVGDVDASGHHDEVTDQTVADTPSSDTAAPEHVRPPDPAAPTSHP